MPLAFPRCAVRPLSMARNGRPRSVPAVETGFPPIATGFPPIAAGDARVLVLGSMPGRASLQRGEYYAHPQNAFWPIVGAIAGAGPELPYDQRAAVLQRCGLAVWDVLQSCARTGSLDADIDKNSIVVNDFATFFATHRELRAVFCNGGAAYGCYRRYVVPNLAVDWRALPLVQLPSTSPAHASLRLAEKLAVWSAAISPWLASCSNGEAPLIS